MTRNEAIAYGKEQLEIFGGLHKEFIQMAIKSLERKRGKNISKDGFLCSVCTFGDFGGFHGYEPNFCPNCGAEMKHD